MFPPLHELEIVTYRALLALHFRDGATGAAVSTGLRAYAWRHDPAQPQVARRLERAERSPQSGIYGFRTLPGLEQYTKRETVTAGSVQYIIQIEDERGRYLPQTRRFGLPLAEPALQEVILFPSPAYSPPPGYGVVRGQLLRTTAVSGAPPEVTVLEPARWARVAVEAPGPSPSDPDVVYHGIADQRGSFLLLVPYPPIPSSTLLEDAGWNVSLAVEHDPAAIAADLDELQQVRPELGEPPPFHTTLLSQSPALLFAEVNVLDAAGRTYEIVGDPDETSVAEMLPFRRPLVIRTRIAGSPESPLSEFLIRS